MAAKEITLQLPSDKFRGLVLNPSQLAVDPNCATLCSNVDKSDSGQLTVRKGIKSIFRKIQTNDFEALFPFTYTFHATEDGSTQEELLALYFPMDSLFASLTPRLLRLVEQTLTVTYVGSGAGRLQLLPVQNSSAPDFFTYWTLFLTANGVVSGPTPFQNATQSSTFSGSTLDGLIQTIHNNANWNCSPTNLSGENDALPIDAIGPFIDEAFTNGSTADFTYYTIEEIGSGDLPPVSFTDANFTLPCALNYSNVIYFAYGSYEYKYDGRFFYRSGLPQPSIVSVADAASGSSHQIGDTYIYKLVFSKIDNQGNVIEGEDSDDTLPDATYIPTTVSDSILTITSLNATNYGHAYDARSAIINGNQAGVTTITVDSGHTLVVDDTAYLYNTVTGLYEERLITAVAATTITIAGAVISVGDNLIISNNVRVQIWRTKNTGVDFYLVAEIPNDSINNTFTHRDGQSDLSLIEPFVEQLRKKSLPPKTSFLAEHQGLKVSAGDPEYPNRVRWTLPDDPEGYPLEANLTDIKGGGLGAITGIGSVDDDALAAFKRTGHMLLDGSLDDLNFRTLNRSNTGIGCTSFRSLANIGEFNTLIGLSLNGPFLFDGRTPQLVLNDALKPLFGDDVRADLQVNGTVTQYTTSNDIYHPTSVSLKRSFERAVGFNDYINKKYHLFVPAEVGTPGELKATVYPSSKWLVYSYEPGSLFWSEYTFYNRYRELNNLGYGPQNVCCNAGLTIYKNRVWYGMFVASFDDSTNIRAVLGQFKNDNTIYDYSDDSYPVYLDLFYVPITREPGSASSFFKPLWAILHRFLSSSTSDPADVTASPDFDPNFTFTLKTVLNHKQYNSNPFSTNAARTFKAATGAILTRFKLIGSKARALQIQINNENAVPASFEKPAFDNLEVVYCIPYDKKSKETKG